MSRYARNKASIEGIHINNDDIKDIAEDVQQILEDFGTVMDPDYPAMREWISKDGAARFEPNIQKLMKLVLSDFDIQSKRDFAVTMERWGSRWAKAGELDPNWGRL